MINIIRMLTFLLVDVITFNKMMTIKLNDAVDNTFLQIITMYDTINITCDVNFPIINFPSTGWNDVGFHNPDIISPNIDYLAKNGMILNHSYVQPVCTP